MKNYYIITCVSNGTKSTKRSLQIWDRIFKSKIDARKSIKDLFTDWIYWDKKTIKIHLIKV